MTNIGFRYNIIAGIKNYLRLRITAKERKDGVMVLTRKYLKAMGIEDEKIDQIIESCTTGSSSESPALCSTMGSINIPRRG